MDVFATLVKVTITNALNQAQQTIFVTNHDDSRATSAMGEAWRPILLTAPEVSTSVFNGDFTSSGQQSLGQLTMTVVDADLDYFSQLVWHGARVEIWALNMASGAVTKTATCRSNGMSRAGRTDVAVELINNDTDLNQNLLYLGYGGSGGIDGTADLLGSVKPFVVGDAKFCEAVLVDPIRQIYQVHGYGPVEAIYGVFEGGQPIGANGQPYASYSTGAGTSFNAFRDAPVPQGSWIRHNDLGLFKLGSQPTFEVSCHVKGDTGGVAGGATLTRAGDIVKRLMNLVVPTVAKNNASLDALSAAVPIAHDLAITSQTTVKEVIEKVLLSLGGYWTWDTNGELIVGRMRFVAPDFDMGMTLSTGPQVLGVGQLSSSAPVWSLKMAAEACHNVHDASGVAGLLTGRDAVTNVINVLDYRAALLGTATVTVNGQNTIFEPGPTPPAGAVDGDLWCDTSTNPAEVRRYDGTNGVWVKVSPEGAQAGDTLYDENGGMLSDADIITSEGTSNDTAHVDGVPSNEVLLRILQADQAIDAINELTQDIIENAEAIETKVEGLELTAGVANLLPNSDWAGVKDAGWGLVTSTPGAFVWDVDNADFIVPGEHYIGLLCNERNGDRSAAIVSDWIAIKPGDWMQASAWLASRECVNSIRLQWGNSGGGFMSEGPSSPTVYHPYRGGTNFSNFSRVWCKGQAPGGAYFVRLVLQKGPFLANPANDLSWMFALRPMVAEATPTLSGPSPYSRSGGGAGLTKVRARIEEVSIVAVSAGAAAAEVRETLEASLTDIDGTTDDLQAQLNTTSQVAVTALDRTSGARWSKEAVAGNGRAQLTVYAFDSNGNVQAGVDIIGDVTISGNLVVSGTITSAKIKDNAVTVPWYVSSTEVIFSQENVKKQILSCDIIKRDSDSILEVNAQIPSWGSDAVQLYIDYELWQNGSPFQTRRFTLKNDANQDTYLPFLYQHHFFNLPTGSYQVKIFTTQIGTNSSRTEGLYHLLAREYIK